MKICSISLVSRKLEIKIIIWYHSISEWLKLKNIDHSKSWGGVEQLTGSLTDCSWVCKVV